MADLTREQIERLVTQYARGATRSFQRDLATTALAALTRAESAEAERDRLAAEVAWLRGGLTALADRLDRDGFGNVTPAVAGFLADRIRTLARGDA